MKFIVAFLLTALLAFVACLFLPWYSIAIAAFIIALIIRQRAGFAFLSGFFALLFLWGGISLYMSIANEHILAHRISLLILKNDNPVFLIIITAVLGAVVAGLAAFSGSLLLKKRA